jgi:hypothetical protein
MLLLCVTASLGVVAQAQTDVIAAVYNEVYAHDFTEDGESVILKFEGKEGDVLYVLADFSSFGDGDLDILLRDSAGNEVGYKEDYLNSPIVFEQLIQQDTYTATITYINEEGNPAEPQETLFIISETGYLSADPLTFTVLDDGFAHVIGVRVDQTGEYRLRMTRDDGEIAPDFVLNDYTGLFRDDIIEIGGVGYSEFSAVIELEANQDYIALLGANLPSLQLSFSQGESATVSITLTPNQ